MTATKIILTGHRGYIGSALKEALETSFPGHVLVATSDLVDETQVKTEFQDLGNQHVLILHFATINRKQCATFEHHAANGKMLMNLLRVTQSCEQRTVLFASTTDVFGSPAKLPLNEDSPHAPNDWYALSKSVGEWILKSEEIPHATFRLPGVFGVRPNEQSLLSRLLSTANETGRVTLNAEGKILRDFIYLDDLVSMILAWVRNPKTGTWNIASGHSSPIVETLKALRRESGRHFDIVQAPYRTSRDFDLVFDVARLLSDFPEIRIRPASETLIDYGLKLRHGTPTR